MICRSCLVLIFLCPILFIAPTTSCSSSRESQTGDDDRIECHYWGKISTITLSFWDGGEVEPGKVLENGKEICGERK